MKILHLSDTHLSGTGALHRTGVDTTEALQGLLADLERLDGIDAVVVTGDVADDGSADAYRIARDRILGFARGHDAMTIFSTGNTDDRSAFADVLGSGHLGPYGEELALSVIESADGERAAVSMVDGLRLVTLDTLVPGKVYGAVSAAQLAWLRDVLADPAPQGTVLAFHHPPLLSDDTVQRALALQEPESLAAAIRGTDVRVVLCGHYHLQLAGRLEQAMVWVGPGVVNRRDLTAGDGTIRYVRGTAATLVNLTDTNAPVFHTMHASDPRSGALLKEFGGAEVQEAIRQMAPPGFDLGGE
jgi:3',5'-cyclic-AMP phosphodiesterase